MCTVGTNAGKDVVPTSAQVTEWLLLTKGVIRNEVLAFLGKSALARPDRDIQYNPTKSPRMSVAQEWYMLCAINNDNVLTLEWSLKT